MRGLTRSLLRLGALGLLLVFTGCYTAQVRSAADALDAARKAGKDKECPGEFDAADQMVRRAEALCQTCQTKEANALAADAMAKINALCPAKAVAAAPAPAPPPPPSAPSPTASLSASPSSVDAGGCSTLTWSTSNASSVSIDGGVGSVDSSGSRQVCPGSTTTYTLSASGAGGSRTSSATVSIAAKATPPKPTDKLTIHVNFDTNKSEIKKSELADLQKAEAFVRKYSTCKIEIDGYTDSTGNDKINNPLSERRAEAVQKWLLDHGATASDHMTVKGYGSSNPVADNKTAKGRAENRRAELLVFCE
jgi:outer membrane protein OmpA-like peptidoglycan-associated protein